MTGFERQLIAFVAGFTVAVLIMFLSYRLAFPCVDAGELAKLFALPEGEWTFTVNPSAVWQKLPNRILAYRPIADERDAHVIKLFGPGGFAPTPAVTTVTSVTTTSTTRLPDRRKRR